MSSDKSVTYVPSCTGEGGDDERQVFAELCDIVEEAIALYQADGKPLLPGTSGRDFANRMQHVA